MWVRFKSYRRQSPQVRQLAREAFLKLGWFRAATLLIKFKYLTRSLQHNARPPAPAPVSPQLQSEAANIGDIVARVAAHTPWQSPCLAQVLAVQSMLAKRHIPGVFYLGAQVNSASETPGSKLAAHAWLSCGSEIINGEAGHEKHTVVSSWSWQ